MNKAEGDVDQLVRSTFFPTQNYGVVVDVGAARPDYISVSSLFRSIGWRVISIEPNPEFCEFYRQRGLEVLQYACGSRDEDNVDFFVVNSHGAPYANGNVSYESFCSLGIKPEYKTLKADLDVKRITVNLRKLDTILRAHASDIDFIDLLSIDVADAMNKGTKSGVVVRR